MSHADNHPESYFFKHRNWEDVLSAIVGLAVLLSPMAIAETYDASVYVYTGIAGCLVFAFAMLELVSLRRWEEYLELILGVSLIAAPWILGYGGSLSTVHVVAGVAVAGLAMLELWQDTGRKSFE